MIQKSFLIEAPFDKIWEAIIETFAELQLPIQNMEKASGLITTDWIDFKGQTNEDYCDCEVYMRMCSIFQFNFIMLPSQIESILFTWGGNGAIEFVKENVGTIEREMILIIQI